MSQNIEKNLPLWDRIATLDVIKYFLWPVIDDRAFLSISRANKNGLHYRHNYNIKTAINGKHTKIFSADSQCVAKTKKNTRCSRKAKVENMCRRHYLKRDENYKFKEENELYRIVNVIVSCKRSFDRIVYSKLKSFEFDGISYAPYYLKELSIFPIFYSLRKLNLGRHFYGNISKGSLPPLLTHLTISHDFSETIEPGVLPDSLTHLSFGKIYDDTDGNIPQKIWSKKFTLSPGVLPLLEVLEFDMTFDQELTPGILPETLKKLNLGRSFNSKINKGVLPPMLKELEIGSLYNQAFEQDVLPNSIESLKIGVAFNQPIEEKTMPSSLKILHLGVLCTGGIYSKKDIIELWSKRFSR